MVKPASQEIRVNRFVPPKGSFVVVELLDPTDSNYFKRKLTNKGFKNITPANDEDTFKSTRPTEEWLKECAKQDPEWWYISGHFARTPEYEITKDKYIVQVKPRTIEKWEVTITQNNALVFGDWDKVLKKIPNAFGAMATVKRTINITNEDGTWKAKGKTQIISVEPYTKGSPYWDCEITNEGVPSRGSAVEMEGYYVTHARDKNGRLSCYNWLMKNISEATRKRWENIPYIKTPGTHPSVEYDVTINSPPIDRNNEKELDKFMFPKKEIEKKGVDLIFKTPRPYYIVTFEGYPSETFRKKYLPKDKQVEYDERWRKNDSQLKIYWLRKFQTCCNLHDVHVKLDDGWNTSYKYVTNENVTDNFRPYILGNHPWDIEDNEDKIDVKLIESKIDSSKDAGFFNKTFYDNEYQKKNISDNSWRIVMEYSDSKNDLKSNNFFEKYGIGSYNNAKIVMLIGCNTLSYPSVRKYLKEIFPNALILGHIYRNPANSTPIIKHFLKTYFQNSQKMYDEEHIIKSWLSYYDTSKNSIIKRGYGLAVLKNTDLLGIEIDGSYPVTLAKDGEMVQRLKLNSIMKDGTIVDSLIVWNEKGTIKCHKYKYIKDDVIYTEDEEVDPFRNTYYFPYLTSLNLNNNKGY